MTMLSWAHIQFRILPTGDRKGSIRGAHIYQKFKFHRCQAGCHYTAKNKSFLLKKFFSSYHTAIAHSTIRLNFQKGDVNRKLVTNEKMAISQLLGHD